MKHKENKRETGAETEQGGDSFRRNLLFKLGDGFVKEIQTPRLRLRPFTPDDAREMHKLAGDPAVSGTDMYLPYPLDYNRVKEWIPTHPYERRTKGNLYFVMEDNIDKRMIGSISLSIDQDHQRAELGAWLGKAYWCRGYCSEAAIALLGYGFMKLDLNRIYAYYLKRNQASARIVEKIGMNHEGSLPGHFKKDGHFEDLCIAGFNSKDYTCKYAVSIIPGRMHRC